ncbi:MAG: hypothetical protein HRT87_01120 [Legionellales bacterium]|nr:hypothetical protein [Legionellales bacterium]
MKKNIQNRTLKFDGAIISANWPNGTDYSRLKTTVDFFVKHKIPVMIILQGFTFKVNVLSYLNTNYVEFLVNGKSNIPIDEFAITGKLVNNKIRKFVPQHPLIMFHHPTNNTDLHDYTNKTAKIIYEGKPLYIDTYHLSIEGSKLSFPLQVFEEF